MIQRKALVIPLVSLLACGCAIAPRARRYERPETDASPATFGRQVDVSNEQCVSWLSSRRAWNGASIGTAALAAGLGGVGSLLDEPDTAVRITLGVGALLLGAFGAFAGSQARSLADDFGRYCVEEPTPPQR